MLKKILLVPFISLFVLAFYYSELVFAVDTGTVTATVTVQNISLSVSDGIVTYGILALGSTKNTTQLTDTQSVTNNGNVTIDVNIKGQNTAAWTLAGTAGADQYVHQFCLATCTTYPTNYTSMTTSYSLAINDLAVGSQNLDLGISAPTSSGSYTEQEVDVMVQAVAA